MTYDENNINYYFNIETGLIILDFKQNFEQIQFDKYNK